MPMSARAAADEPTDVTVCRMSELMFLQHALVLDRMGPEWTETRFAEAWQRETSPTELERTCLWSGGRIERPPGPARMRSQQERVAWIRTVMPAPPRRLDELIRITRLVRDIGLPNNSVMADWAAAALWCWRIIEARGSDVLAAVWQVASEPFDLVTLLQMVEWPAANRAHPLTLVDTRIDAFAWEASACASIRALVDRAPRLDDLWSANDARRSSGKAPFVIWEFLEHATRNLALFQPFFSVS
jgi:hypothetical protein